MNLTGLFLRTSSLAKLAMEEVSLPPLYGRTISLAFGPAGKNFKVGYPETSNFKASYELTVASTFPTLIPSFLSSVAKAAQCGTKFLQ